MSIRSRLGSWLRQLLPSRGSPAAPPAARIEPSFPTPIKIAPSVVAQSRRSAVPATVWKIPEAPPGMIPSAGVGMAQDDGITGLYDWASSGAGYAGGLAAGLYGEGLSFMGYPWLAELSQRPEYRRGSEIVAKEMTREWLELTASGDGDKSDKLSKIDDEFKRLKVQAMFRKGAEHDGFFGKGQLFLDMGNDDPNELMTPLIIDKVKIGIGSLKRLTPVEPVWTYPAKYGTTDPLAPDFYRPQAWYARGKQVHASRWLTFIAREVPDLLKPAYMFGGLSLSQMGKPAVDNWLGTRKAVSDLISSFSTMILKTNMQATLTGDGGTGLADRLALFNNYRDNSGTFAIDKELEDFDNVSAPLASLDALQAQAQEHMPSIWGIPLVIFFGITPSGLNSSSDGELAAWNTWVHSMQEHVFNDNVTKLLQIVQLSLFGEIDPDIGHKWIALGKLSEVDKATIRKTDAETGAILIGDGAIIPNEERKRITEAEETLYPGLDALDEPDDNDLDLDLDPELDPELAAAA